MAIDTSWSNVSLLCPFSADAQDVSGNNFTKGRIITPLNGAALSSAVGTPFGAGNAMHFDGTNDYATTPAHNDFVFGSGDFTIEAGVYIAGNSAADGGGNKEACIAANYQSGGGWALVIAGNGSTTGTGIYLAYWNGSSWTTIVSVTTTVSQGAWHYIMAKRVGTATQIWLDAASATTGTNSTNMSLGQLMNFGGISAHTSYQKWLNGYISDLRITKGVGRTVTAAPTAPFPRPTISGHVYDAAAAPVAKSILLYDRSTGRYVGGANSDPSTGAYTLYPPNFGEFQVTRMDELGDPVTDEAVFDLDPAAGGTSGGQPNTDTRGRLLTWTNEARVGADGTYFEFDGSADYVQSTSVLYALGTDDFCIDIEFYPISGGRLSGSYNRILQIGPNATAGTLAIYCNATDNPTRIIAQFYDTSWHTVVWSDPTTYANSTWHKMQLRRVSGVFTLTINDTLVATSATLAYNITGTLLSIGSNTSGTESFYGRLGKIRISRGARRAAAATPTSRLLKMPADGGSGENALVYDRVIPGG